VRGLIWRISAACSIVYIVLSMYSPIYKQLFTPVR
jgi:hypothetical protein